MNYLQNGIHLFVLYGAIKKGGRLNNATVRGPCGTLLKYIYDVLVSVANELKAPERLCIG